jgi:hypothetical protein
VCSERPWCISINGVEMKRSAMLEFMWNFIQNIENDYDKYMEESDVDDLLKAMEEIGMSPPFDHDMYYNTWRDGGNGHTWVPEEKQYDIHDFPRLPGRIINLDDPDGD